MFSPKRCLADSNCCRRFCRPLTKPLIQGTIIKFACKGNTIIRSFQTNHVFFSFFAPTVPQQSGGREMGRTGGANASPRFDIAINRPSTARRPSCPTLVGQARQCVDHASTMRRPACPTLVGQAPPCLSPAPASQQRKATNAWPLPPAREYWRRLQYQYIISNGCTRNGSAEPTDKSKFTTLFFPNRLAPRLVPHTPYVPRRCIALCAFRVFCPRRGRE